MSVNSVQGNQDNKEISQNNANNPKPQKLRVAQQEISKLKEKLGDKCKLVGTTKEIPSKSLKELNIRNETVNYHRVSNDVTVSVNPSVPLGFNARNAQETIKDYFKSPDTNKIAGKILKILAKSDDNFELLINTLVKFYNQLQDKEKPHFYEVIAVLAGFDDKNESCRKLVAKLARHIQSLGTEGDVKDLINALYAKYKTSPSLYPIIYSFMKIDLLHEKLDATLLRIFSVSNALTAALTQDLLAETRIRKNVQEALKNAEGFNLKTKEGIEKYQALIKSIGTECFCLGESDDRKKSKKYKQFIQTRRDIVVAYFKNQVSPTFTINSDIFFYGLALAISTISHQNQTNNVAQVALMKNLKAFFQQTAKDSDFTPEKEISCLNSSLKDINFVRSHYSEK